MLRSCARRTVTITANDRQTMGRNASDTPYVLHYTDIPPKIPSAVKQTSIADPHLFIIAGDMASLRRAQQASMHVPTADAAAAVPRNLHPRTLLL